nr:hypothetical protein [uncultured Dongia sp.]
MGTSGDDFLPGTSIGETFVGGLGNDVLTGGGGGDAFQGGAGDDEIHVSDGAFRKVDGGGGFDILHLDFAGAIDFGNIDRDTATADHTKIRSIESIDVDNGLANQLTLYVSDLLEIDAGGPDLGGAATLDNVLKIDGNIGDSLLLDPADDWGLPIARPWRDMRFTPPEMSRLRSIRILSRQWPD